MSNVLSELGIYVVGNQVKVTGNLAGADIKSMSKMRKKINAKNQTRLMNKYTTVESINDDVCSDAPSEDEDEYGVQYIKEEEEDTNAIKKEEVSLVSQIQKTKRVNQTITHKTKVEKPPDIYPIFAKLQSCILANDFQGFQHLLSFVSPSCINFQFTNNHLDYLGTGYTLLHLLGMKNRGRFFLQSLIGLFGTYLDVNMTNSLNQTCLFVGVQFASVDFISVLLDCNLFVLNMSIVDIYGQDLWSYCRANLSLYNGADRRHEVIYKLLQRYLM